MKKLSEMIKEKTFVVIDIETTGLNSNPANGEVAHILEVAAMKIEGGKLTKKYGSFCACPISIPPEIVELTKINDELLKNAPTVEVVLKKLKDFSKGSILMGHNLKFDLGFLNYYGEKYGVSFQGKYIDTLKLSQKILKGEVSDYRLGTIAKYFGIKLRGNGALFDAERTAKIFLDLAKAEAFMDWIFCVKNFD